MVTHSRIQRTTPEMLEALHRQLRLLREFAKRAFEDSDYDYHGEVAAKLRLLVWDPLPSPRPSRHRPLLLTLMDEFGIEVPISVREMNTPGKPVVAIPVRTYLTDEVGLEWSDGRTVRLPRIEFVCMWAEQHGAAHEDWSFREEFVSARYSGAFIGNEPAMVRMLRLTTDHVLAVADAFLAQLREVRARS